MTETADPDRRAVENLQEYLRIKTDHPDPDYDPAVDFIRKMASELDLDVQISGSREHPTVVLKWEGLKPEMESLMLNSHIDVVPAVDEKWTYPPYSAHIDENGDIFARGTQDMKSAGIHYLEAIRRLKKEKRRFKRSIYVVFVPDEEIGGGPGMGTFVESEMFENMNVGFALDEGSPSPTERFLVYYAEKARWELEFIGHGNAGHASRFIQNTAAEKMSKIVNLALEYRTSQEMRLKENEDLLQGEVTSLNLTKIHGGEQSNVVPASISVLFDIRVGVHENESDLKAMLHKWQREAGGDIDLVFHRMRKIVNSPKPSKDNHWFAAFYKTVEDLGMKIDLEICAGSSDMRYIRQKNILALNFQPMNFTEFRLHDHDEYINEKVFLRGIGVYEKLISELADC